MSSSSGRKEKLFIVIQDLSDAANCKVIPTGDQYAATYRQAHGPATREECEKWVARHCVGGK
jgi:DeoR/GlpR family transcriptional regulator of sugar metabolism